MQPPQPRFYPVTFRSPAKCHSYWTTMVGQRIFLLFISFTKQYSNQDKINTHFNIIHAMFAYRICTYLYNAAIYMCAHKALKLQVLRQKMMLHCYIWQSCTDDGNIFLSLCQPTTSIPNVLAMCGIVLSPTTFNSYR